MVQAEPSIHTNLIDLVGWLYIEAPFGCYDILILGTSPINWRQRPDMTIAVDWDAKHQFKQTYIHKYLARDQAGQMG